MDNTILGWTIIILIGFVAVLYILVQFGSRKHFSSQVELRQEQARSRSYLIFAGFFLLFGLILLLFAPLAGTLSTIAGLLFVIIGAVKYWRLRSL